MQKVRKGEEINTEQLAVFLFQNNIIQNIDSEINVVQFPGGYSNLTYALEIEGKEYVLRRPPFGAVKIGHDMGREYKVLSKLNPVFPKAPRTFIYTENMDVIGAPFYMMEKVEGEIIRPHNAKQLNISENEFKTIAGAWLDTFVELHNVDYKSAGLEDLGKPEGYVERQVINWGKQYLKAATDDIPTAEKVMYWLQENQPIKYDSTLIHNDFKYDNIVYAKNDWSKVIAVLDWEMCTLGDPLMDLGTSLSYWFTADDPPWLTIGLPMTTGEPGNPSRIEIVELYEKLSGRKVDHLVFYYAYGLFKIAVIVQQIYYRYKKGYTTDERFAQLNKATMAFINTAWQAIQKNRIVDLY
ncbi:MAG: phosphotransferase family protein [Saprospiraceae bacterium]